MGCRRSVGCRFDGREITSDTGLFFLSQADRKVGLTKRLAMQNKVGRIGTWSYDGRLDEEDQRGDELY